MSISKKAAWALTVGVAAPALAFSLSGTAMADSFSTGGTMAGPDGAGVHGVYTGVTENGDVYYVEGHRMAGPDGVASEWTVSESGNWSHGGK
ncbi:hypothetical protein [Nocardiopsis coralliicola]